MRRLRIDDPSVLGAVLARDLRSPTGDMLARAGLTMTRRAVRALGAHGVDLCFVEDAASQGVSAHPIVDALGADAPLMQALRDACGVVWKLAEGSANRPTPRAVEELRDMRIIGALDTSGATEALRTAVTVFIDRVAGHEAESGFLTDRLAGDDLFGHSAGVAALTIRLGMDIGFEGADLHSAALAALTHDIGLLMVPEEIRRAPASRRTPAQKRRYEDHTVLGHALLSGVEYRQPALPAVALEHHEEQSGGGYPRGLTGGNRVLRSASAAFSRDPASARTTGRSTSGSMPGQISLVAEVVAVADRFERLTSPAPGSVALSPAAARRVLSLQAGSRLNAEVVGRFLDLIPQWPVGTEVILAGGALAGARALVIALDPDRVDRPIVRVFADRAGEPIEPFEVSLAIDPSLGLTVADAVVAA